MHHPQQTFWVANVRHKLLGAREGNVLPRRFFGNATVWSQGCFDII
jgi:hypothetical protein